MTARWSPFAKQFIVVGALAATIWFLDRISVLLTPLILALLLAYLVSFPTDWLIHRTGWPRWAVVAVLYVLVIVILIVGPVLLVPKLVALFGELGVTLRHIVTELSATSPKPVNITPTLSIDLGPLYAPINQWLTATLQPETAGAINWQSFLFPFASSAVVVVRGAVTGLIWTIFILAVSFYVAKDAPVMGRFLTSRVPGPWLPELKHLWHELALIWDAFVRGQILLGLSMGVLIWLLTSFLGVRNSAALGLLSGLAEFVPGVGPVVVALPAILIALILGSTWLPLPHLWFAVLVGLTYFLMSQFENMYLLPRIVGRRISLHPVVVVVGALAGASIGGVLGILLAAPVIASLRVLFGYVVHRLLDQEPFPPEVPESSAQDVYWRALLRDRRVAAVLFDLDGTLVELDDRRLADLVKRLAPLKRLLPFLQLDNAARRWLIAGDSGVNAISTLLSRLGGHSLLIKLNDRFHRWRAYCAPAGMVPVDGSLEALATLSRRYPLALITTRSTRPTSRPTWLASVCPACSRPSLPATMCARWSRIQVRSPWQPKGWGSRLGSA